MTRITPTSIKLPDDLKRDLKRFAKTEDVEVERRSVSWYIIYILQKYIAYKKGKASENGPDHHND